MDTSVAKSPHGVRAYLRGLMLGSAVALQQLGKDPESSVRSMPPFVQILPDNDDRGRELERVGPVVLTRGLISDRPDTWTPNLN